MKTIIIGKSAAGKDYLRKILVKKGYTYGVPYTTRPMRDNEKKGEDYYFIDNNVFNSMLDDGLFYYFENFNGWFYGITHTDWVKNNLFIMTPSAIKKLKKNDRIKSTIIYLDIPIEIRKKRLENRNISYDSIERRIAADELDFNLFTDFDLSVNFIR